MCGITIDSGRSQPSLAFNLSNGSSNIKSSKSSPLLATDDDMIKCKYLTKSSQLGDGNFSVVKECINVQTKETYAMKLVHKNLVKNKLQLIKREFGLLNALSAEIRHLENHNNNNNIQLDYFQGHHHILQLYDYFETEENIVLITQLCDKDDLYEKIIQNGHLNLNKQVAAYTACMISVLQFLHSQHVIHRDIKAENVLFRLHKKQQPQLLTLNKLPEQYDLSAHDLILADFGLATRITDPNATSLKEYVGTISYIAPEIVKCKSVAFMGTEELSNVQSYGTGVDIWALGVLVFFMAFGYTPFDCETDEETLDCISKCDYYIDEEYSNNPEYKDFWNFIKCCFIVDPKKRCTAEQLRSHPFIEKFFDNNNNNNNNNSSHVVSTAVSIGPNSLTVDRPDLGPRNHSFNTLRRLQSPERSDPSLNPLSWTSSHDSNYSYTVMPNNNTNTSGNNLLNHDSSFVAINTNSSDESKKTTTNHNNNNSNNKTNSKKPMIRRTISMTSVKNSPSSYKVNKVNNASIIASHSTFFLDPQPPKGSLMNGRFSENPQQLTNFDSTPRSLSRENSSRSLFSLISHESDDGTQHHHKEISDNNWHDNDFHQMEGGTVTFELGSSDEED
ncbi:similar to Saccharomyces cerevisiae YMR291W TDA1 Putative kinase of unknown function [Maudiozyma saulgeensis]|uniref:Protein kinase domain-containing protein n=1 Tax=Maudiozyma saulgeensis TaxID=1789683 RepID=A0A1X7RAN8_9SACH|nr:similar to Saccharomyces cerevisiae YMR291W TDA1 Putative kinase of unknown function [Kazachstania saulgeensis]